MIYKVLSKKRKLFLGEWTVFDEESFKNRIIKFLKKHKSIDELYYQKEFQDFMEKKESNKKYKSSFAPGNEKFTLLFIEDLKKSDIYVEVLISDVINMLMKNKLNYKFLENMINYYYYILTKESIEKIYYSIKEIVEDYVEKTPEAIVKALLYRYDPKRQFIFILKHQEKVFSHDTFFFDEYMKYFLEYREGHYMVYVPFDEDIEIIDVICSNKDEDIVISEEFKTEFKDDKLFIFNSFKEYSEEQLQKYSSGLFLISFLETTYSKRAIVDTYAGTLKKEKDSYYVEYHGKLKSIEQINKIIIVKHRGINGK